MEAKHGIKKLTLENWREPDDVSLIYCGIYDRDVRSMDGSDWVTWIIKIELSPSVPAEVEKLFETAKAALCYGWFFHSLFTFGMEQVCRVAETAVKVKCQEIGLFKDRERFQTRIKKLAARGVITADEAEWWDFLRELRNVGSHPDQQMILTAGENSRLVKEIAEQISALFPE